MNKLIDTGSIIPVLASLCFVVVAYLAAHPFQYALLNSDALYLPALFAYLSSHNVAPAWRDLSVTIGVVSNDTRHPLGVRIGIIHIRTGVIGDGCRGRSGP